MEITYLLNSGFMVKDGNILMLFDDFDDPSQSADLEIDKGDFEQLYIFGAIDCKEGTKIFLTPFDIRFNICPKYILIGKQVSVTTRPAPSVIVCFVVGSESTILIPNAVKKPYQNG